MFWSVDRWRRVRLKRMDSAEQVLRFDDGVDSAEPRPMSWSTPRWTSGDGERF